MASVSAFPKLKPSRWFTDFEDGTLNAWDSLEQSGAAPLPTVVTSRVEFGSYAMQCGPLGLNNYRSEAVIQPNRFDLWGAQNQVVYYGWSVYYGGDFPLGTSAFQATGQWHSPTGGANGAWDSASPPLAFYVGCAIDGMSGYELCIGGSGNNPGNYPFWFQSLGDVPRNKWSHITIRVQWGNTTIGTGNVTVWLDGRLVVPTYSPPASPLIYPCDNGQRYNYFKLGYYRSNTIATVNSVFYDCARIGSSFEGADTTTQYLER